MKLELASWGGFTGKAGQEVREVEVERLPAPERQALAKLVEAAGLFALPASLLKAAPRSHDFQHALTVTDGERRHTVTFHEDQAPPGLKALYRHLRQTVEKR